MHLRIRAKKIGTHYHCRVFSGREENSTHARNGELIFSENEWLEVKEQLSRIAEVIDETEAARLIQP